METVELVKMTKLVEEKRLEVQQLCGRAIDNAEQIMARWGRCDDGNGLESKVGEDLAY